MRHRRPRAPAMVSGCTFGADLADGAGAPVEQWQVAICPDGPETEVYRQNAGECPTG